MGHFTSELKKSPALRALVVDDEPLIRWSLAQTLADEGWDVIEAGDGHMAVKAAARTDDAFDVVVLDFRLPDSNDLTLFDRLRALTPRAVIILMTAFGTPELTRMALDHGAHCVLSKPFEMGEIVEIIAKARRSRPS